MQFRLRRSRFQSPKTKVFWNILKIAETINLLIRWKRFLGWYVISLKDNPLRTLYVFM